MLYIAGILKSAIGAGLGVLAMTSVARATPIASENFDDGGVNYTNGAHLSSPASSSSGLSGGSGWSGEWSEATAGGNSGSPNSLPYLTTGLNPTDSTDYAAELDSRGTYGNAGTSSLVYRQFVPTASAYTSGTIYVSFEMDMLDTTNRTTLLSIQGGTPSSPNTAAEVDIGVAYSGGNLQTSNPSNDFAVSGSGDSTLSSGNLTSTVATPNTDFLLVAQINISTDTVNLYVNPGATLPGTPSATATLTGLTGGLDMVRLFAGGPAGNASGTAAIFDQIEIGDAYADVVPEPASLGFLGIGVMALSLCRPRRKLA